MIGRSSGSVMRNKLLAIIRAVDARHFIQFNRDGLHSGEEHQRIKAEAFPDADDDHRDHGGLRIAQPGMGELIEADAAQDQVDQPEILAVHEAPGYGDDDPRQHPGDDHQNPRQPAPRKALVQEQREVDAHDHLPKA